jgi:hypothetical protein
MKKPAHDTSLADGRVEAGESRNPADVAAYVAEMAADLARLARSAGLGALAYLLEMAVTEANGVGYKRE